MGGKYYKYMSYLLNENKYDIPIIFLDEWTKYYKDLGSSKFIFVFNVISIKSWLGLLNCHNC